MRDYSHPYLTRLRSRYKWRRIEAIVRTAMVILVISASIGMPGQSGWAQEPASGEQATAQALLIQADSTAVYVDANKGSVFGSGSSTNPVKHLTAARDKVSPGGTIYLAPATYGEALTIDKPMTLRNSGQNPVVIGAHVANTSDLSADRLEVTQGIQDLNNSVRLVARKRTYVRFHVHSSTLVNGVNAQLRIQGNGQTVVLNPLKRINVSPTPDRAVRDDAFLFELPSNLTRGALNLTATILPTVDNNLSNNTVSANVTFESVPQIALVLYRAKYSLNKTAYQPANSHIDQLITWLHKAYPLSSDGIDIYRREIDLGKGSTFKDKKDNSIFTFNDSTEKGCTVVNSRLTRIRDTDVATSNRPPIPGSLIIVTPDTIVPIPQNAHYYAMVDDGGDFMRGCSPTPGFVASGPTGTDNWGWDDDGSYGDWYGGHELGHSYGRYHAEFCGSIAFNDKNHNEIKDPGEDYPSEYSAYPYSSGLISPSMSGDNALFGFDIDTHAIFTPANWHDMMTYCDNQWISDITYETLMNTFQAQDVQAAHVPVVTPMDRLLVVGVIDPISNTVALEPMQVLPQATDIEPRVPGDYAIVLRDSNNQELARYSFTPEQSHGGPALQTTDPSPFHEDESLYISELVPYVVGTAKVEITGPGGAVLTNILAGNNNPIVSLLSPNGGETLTDTNIIIRWTASDLDGDPLFFTVQYSPDNGINWETVAQITGETQVEVTRNNLLPSQQGHFRVLTTDGIHTSQDQSDGPFTIPNHAPTATIITPQTAVTITLYDTLALEGKAEDADNGSLRANQLTWVSSRDGILGTGSSLSVVGLSVGGHVITFQATDGSGASASDSVQVTVEGDGNNLQAPVLQVSPRNLIFQTTQGGNTSPSQVLTISNGGGGTLLWTITETIPWLSLSQQSGTDQATITVVVDMTGLAVGAYTGDIQISGEAQSIIIPVTLAIQAANTSPTLSRVYLPLVRR